ncbi:MAG: hypothetical protein HGA78_10605, partial [Nitrospirales bacterium]|nr:hypothetical protein [Nitrospirales bacterium]
MENILSSSLLLPDPERAQKNIESFIAANPEHAERLTAVLPIVSTLFSYSQFLANHCIRKPDSLFECLNRLHTHFDAERLREDLEGLLSSCRSLDDGMKVVRDFRKERLLTITLKDLLRQAEPQEVMREMSNLADAVLSAALPFVEGFLVNRYGRPEGNSMVVMALGKLGARELNYSSDVDIIYVYRDEGETSGAPTIQGTSMNRISAFEYYCKLAEEHSRFLSRITGDGFAYRVDLRLRPQGTRGSLALSLRGHEDYYESWGQLWERAAFLRVRPVAGDMELGNDFLALIRPFVYRKYLGFDAIEEIRRMKSQVEQIKPGTQSRDIKRGYGGIREIEFFIQIFQLIYGGRLPGLRERGTLKALHRLLQKGLVGFDDVRHLSDNYIYLRTLEHRIQQLNDIQTHSLPSGDLELEILGRKMGFSSRGEFLADLELRRKKVRGIYDSLLESRGTSEQEDTAGLLSAEFWDMDSPREHLLEESLSLWNLRNVSRTIHLLAKIRNTMHSCGYINEKPLRRLAKLLDAADIDLKAFTEDFYSRICGGRLKPVLDALVVLRQENVWLEITNLVLPGLNDDTKQIGAMCRWIVKELGPDVPVHFSRFHPQYKLKDLPPTPLATLKDAHQIARDAGIRYPYIGNIRSEAESTFCHKCRRLLIERVGYFVKQNQVVQGKCRSC